MSKFTEGDHAFPSCDVAIVEGEAWRFGDQSLGFRPGVMAELCQLSLDAGIAEFTCWVEL